MSVSSVTRRDTYANKCPDAKAKDGKGYFKVRQLEDPKDEEKKDERSIRQIKIRHSDLNSGYHDLTLLDQDLLRPYSSWLLILSFWLRCS